MAETRTVVVGETTYNIQPFRAFKGELALTIVSRLTGEVQEVLEHVRTFEKQWHEDNPLRITREVCSTRIANFQGAAATAREMGKKAPEKSEDEKTRDEFAAEAHFYDSRVQMWEGQLKILGDKPFVEVPDEAGPPMQEVVLAAFPKAWQTMPEAVHQLLALVVIQNRDLRQADQDDRWEEALTQLGKELFYDGEIGELMQLAVVASEVIEGEVANYQAAVGKLRSLYDRLTGRQKRLAKEAKEKREIEAGEATLKTDSPSESSSSPSASDSEPGPETTSSTEPVGASPSP